MKCLINILIKINDSYLAYAKAFDLNWIGNLNYSEKIKKWKE